MSDPLDLLLDFEEAIEDLDNGFDDDYCVIQGEALLDACASTLRRVGEALGLIGSSESADPLWAVIESLGEPYASSAREVEIGETTLRELAADACYRGELDYDDVNTADEARSCIHDALHKLRLALEEKITETDE